MAQRLLFVALLGFAASASLAQTSLTPPPPAGTAGSQKANPPGMPASGVTQRVRHAAANSVDAQGHTLDTHGNPVGQAPLPPPASPVVQPVDAAQPAGATQPTGTVPAGAAQPVKLLGQPAPPTTVH